MSFEAFQAANYQWLIITTVGLVMSTNVFLTGMLLLWTEHCIMAVLSFIMVINFEDYTLPASTIMISASFYANTLLAAYLCEELTQLVSLNSRPTMTDCGPIGVSEKVVFGVSFGLGSKVTETESFHGTRVEALNQAMRMRLPIAWVYTRSKSARVWSWLHKGSRMGERSEREEKAEVGPERLEIESRASEVNSQQSKYMDRKKSEAKDGDGKDWKSAGMRGVRVHRGRSEYGWRGHQMVQYRVGMDVLRNTRGSVTIVEACHDASLSLGSSVQPVSLLETVSVGCVTCANDVSETR
ncbi:hypothetical protein C8Q74DRAFT_1437169 [Fomes fomentarius]|nr:hypothetical protein C8Q74DRAFT_1437169 [Fomes fomentarius]